VVNIVVRLVLPHQIGQDLAVHGLPGFQDRTAAGGASIPSPYHLEHARDFLSRVTAASPRTVFAIGSTGLALGQDVHRRTAEMGYWLAEPFAVNPAGRTGRNPLFEPRPSGSRPLRKAARRAAGESGHAPPRSVRVSPVMQP